MWKQWAVLTLALFISLMGLLVNPPLIWAHQRVVAPPATASPSVTMTVTAVPAFLTFPVTVQNGHEYQTNGYKATVHNTVTGASPGAFLLTRFIFSAQPPTNGDLPEVAPDEVEIGTSECKVGSSQVIKQLYNQIKQLYNSYTIPACPQSLANASMLDWSPYQSDPVTSPSQSGQWLQAKMYSFPQFYVGNLQTDADWLQFRIGESQVMYLPSLQGTPTPPLEGTPTPIV